MCDYRYIHHETPLTDRLRRLLLVAEWAERLFPVLGDQGDLDLIGLEPWSSQTNDFKIDICRSNSSQLKPMT